MYLLFKSLLLYIYSIYSCNEKVNSFLNFLWRKCGKYILFTLYPFLDKVQMYYKTIRTIGFTVCFTVEADGRVKAFCPLYVKQGVKVRSMLTWILHLTVRRRKKRKKRQMLTRILQTGDIRVNSQSRIIYLYPEGRGKAHKIN